MSSNQPAVSYQAIYRESMKEAAAQGKVLMHRMVRRAAQAAQNFKSTISDERERKFAAEASLMLLKHEAALCESFPQALLAEFAQAISGASQKASTFSFDSLELMGDEQMQQSVDRLRLEQSVRNAVESEMTELNALMCAAQGLARVQVDRNPLRPEVYVRSLRAVIDQSPVTMWTRNRWLQDLGEAMGPELSVAYRELCDSLRKQGLKAAGYTVIASAPAKTSKTPSSVPSEAAQAGALLTVKELRRLLAGELDATRGEADPAPATDFGVTMPAAFEALQEMRQVDEVMKRLRQRHLGGQSDDESDALHQQLQRRARGVGQALGLEVVNLMVENIASDARLLEPVQRAVRDLEPALLRLVLVDPRFFSDRKHPARRLLDQMTQRSLAWQSVDAPGFGAFMEPLRQAVEVLVATQAEGADPFEFALATLEDVWGERQRREKRHREKAVRALLRAEQRNLLADKVAAGMRARTDLVLAPPAVAAFVTGPWSQVIAQARLSDTSGSADPAGYLALVPELLWSVQPGAASANAAKLNRLMPLLQQELWQGLATIDFPAASSQRFLDHLASIHQSVVEGRPPPPPPGEALESAWLAPREAEFTGFTDTHHSISGGQVFQQTQPGFGDTRPRDSETAAPAADLGLHAGMWIELLGDGRWTRYQITWASPHATLLMFVDAEGKTHSMPRQLLEKMLGFGALRVVSDQPVVDGALDAVAQAALTNSLRLAK